MSNMSWKKGNSYDGDYWLSVKFEVKNKVFTGTIDVKRSRNKASFAFQSLGISNKIIKVATDEEMQKEAEAFLLKKLNDRLFEFSEMISLLENTKKSS